MIGAEMMDKTDREVFSKEGRGAMAVSGAEEEMHGEKWY